MNAGAAQALPVHRLGSEQTRGPTRNAPNGFTLVELLVAMTLTGMALAGGAAMLAVLTDIRLASADRLETVAAEAAQRRALNDLLSGALAGTPSRPHPFYGTDARRGGLPDDEILFDVAAAEPYAVQEATVRLFIDRDGDTAERGLVAEFTMGEGSKPIRVELVPGAVALDAEYLPPDPRAGVWLRGWVSTVQLPAAVRLHVIANVGVSPPLLGLPILVPMGPAT